jgi:hypothetical protein
MALLTPQQRAPTFTRHRIFLMKGMRNPKLSMALPMAAIRNAHAVWPLRQTTFTALQATPPMKQIRCRYSLLCCKVYDKVCVCISADCDSVSSRWQLPSPRFYCFIVSQMPCHARWSAVIVAAFSSASITRRRDDVCPSLTPRNGDEGWI